ncbi:hypothetical protein VTI74DRAFT_9232 [Chaetomium olivicolor]
MRLRVTLGAVAGFWLASAAAVPMLNKAIESTCSSTAAVDATSAPPKSTCSSTAVEQATTPLANATCSSTAGEQATAPIITSSYMPNIITVTVSPSTPCASSSTAGALPFSAPANSSFPTLPPGPSGFNSSSCAASQTAASVPQGSAEASAPVTVTVTSIATARSTINVPEVTTVFSVLSDAAESAAVSVVTITVPADSETAVSAADGITIPPVPTVPPVPTPPTVTVPKMSTGNIISTMTVTYPDGLGRTTTLLIPVTIPTAMAASVALNSSSPAVVTVTEPLVTVTASASSAIPYGQLTSSGSSASVIVVTYTVPAESGIGRSTYTVTYTVHPSSSGSGSGPTSAPGNVSSAETASLPTLKTTTRFGSLTSSNPALSSPAAPPTSISVITVTIMASTSTGTDIPSFISSAEPVSATSVASGYGGVGTSTIALTRTSSFPRPELTSSSNTDLVTDWNPYSFDTTGAVLPTSIPGSSTTASSVSSSSAAVVTIPRANITISWSKGPVTFTRVSDVTFSQTVSVNPLSSTVIVVTTKVTILPTVTPSTASVPISSTTPAVATTTVSDTYGAGSTALISTTIPHEPSTMLSKTSDLPWSRPPGVAGNSTGVGPTNTPVIVTIWPTTTSLSISSGPCPVVTTPPASTTELASPEQGTSSSLGLTSVSSSSCTSGEGSTSMVEPIGSTTSQSTTAAPSEITIWPPPALNVSCTTFSTSRSSAGLSVTGTTATPLFSLTTLPPAANGSSTYSIKGSSSCTEGASIIGTPPASLSAFEMTPNQAPPQTEFHHHSHASGEDLNAALTTTFGGYVFSTSVAGYNGPAPSITTPSPASPISSTDANLPVTQPTPISNTAAGYDTDIAATGQRHYFHSSVEHYLGLNDRNVTAPSPTVVLNSTGTIREVVLSFDDVPAVAADTNAEPEPVPSPYHRFSFSKGFHLLSSEAAKYEPLSGSGMLEYTSSSSISAEIDLGELRGNPCFRFNFEGISLGCDSIELPCVFEVTGLQWNGVENVVQGTKTFELAACDEPTHCALSLLAPDSATAPLFSNLTAINITLSQPSDTQTWWADDLRVSWTEDDCTSAACRAEVPDMAQVARPARSLSGRAKGFLRWAVRG